MHFLPDVYVTCDVCNGRRFNAETLEVRYKGKNIPEVLDMTIEEGHAFFRHIPTIAPKLKTLARRGPRLRQARPVGPHALRRRGPAREALLRALPAEHGQDLLLPRRADDGPAFRRRQAAHGGDPAPRGQRATPW